MLKTERNFFSKFTIQPMYKYTRILKTNWTNIPITA